MKANLTPAMKQYVDIKSEHSDAVLFFRMGDFYEMFFDDAKLASKVLGIALTSRDREKQIPMCGVPHHAAASYVAKLVREGYKVAICEQVEDPSEADGVVERAVKRVVTPGIAFDDELLESDSNNFIAAVTGNEPHYGLSCMDVTTGEFRITEVRGERNLIDEIKRLNPSELLVDQGLSPGLNAVSSENEAYSFKNITVLPSLSFSIKKAFEKLLSHFNAASLDGFGCAGFTSGIGAAGALLDYVKTTQKADIKHVRKLIPYGVDNYLSMDYVTRRNLEIEQNSRTLERKGSLLELLDRTGTAMGGRKLRRWLSNPLKDLNGIRARLDSVEELMERRSERRTIALELKSIYDLERLGARVSIGMAAPKDLAMLKTSLEKVKALKGILTAFSTELLKEVRSSADEAHDVVSLIERSVVEAPPLSTRDGGFIKDGYSKELDELRHISHGGKDWVARLEAGERKKTGIAGLKVGYNKIFGYYIEITNSNLKNAPPDYIRKQTLVNAERFVTPELKEWEAKILASEEKAKALELKIFDEVVSEISRHIGRIQATAEALAVLDALASFSGISEEMGYVKPDMTDSDAFIVEEGRHPVIEKNLSFEFVPNDTRLDTSTNQLIVITGPNMAGKSTYVRQVALIAIMAHAGCFVPAKMAVIGVMDKIFTRVGASDDISRGHSTFMVEMSETANILNNATRKSLVILDEIGRGTSTFDGLSIAWAAAEYIHDNLGAKTLFATHYHELTELSLTKERVKNYNMAVKEWNDKITFLRKIVPGGASRSYGIHVAELAGLPAPIIDRAKEILRNLESGELTESGMPRLAHGKNQHGLLKGTAVQLTMPVADVTKKDQVRHELEKIDIAGTTPLEALCVLSKLKELLDK
ncbi:MAG: DNA mismatch repair protein MutS [Thermodesulfobacteriota bacterium]